MAFNNQNKKWVHCIHCGKANYAKKFYQCADGYYYCEEKFRDEKTIFTFLNRVMALVASAAA